MVNINILGEKVCIKTCRPGSLGLDEPAIGLTEDLFKEAVQMTHFEHQNVMKLIGVSIDTKQNPELVMPLMELGDLLKFLKDPVNRLTYPQVRAYGRLVRRRPTNQKLFRV